MKRGQSGQQGLEETIQAVTRTQEFLDNITATINSVLAERKGQK